MANMKLIETKTVGAGGVAFVTFSAIPQTYTDLQILYSARRSAGSDYAGNLYLTFNGATSRYYETLLYQAGGSVGSVAKSNVDAYLNWTALAQSLGTNVWSSGQFYIPNYTSSNAKLISSEFVSEDTNTNPWFLINAALWDPTSNVPITSITFTPASNNIASGSTFYLYGIKNS